MDIAVIGLGLIGGSLLRALAGAGHRVFGYDSDPATRLVARAAAAQAPGGTGWQVPDGVAQSVRPSPGQPVELAVLAVPLPAVRPVLAELVAAGYAGLVTDVTSVKGPVRELAGEYLSVPGDPPAGFVGGHPMAGRETSGFGAADPALFTGNPWALCLEEETRLPAWLTIAALVTSLGARVVPTTAQAHDRAVAAVSHVPHLLAAALAARMATDPLAATLAAGSFRDGTRVAAAAPALIASIVGGNAGPVRQALDAVLADLAGARGALSQPDPISALRPWLTPGCAARAGWPPAASAPEELPARRDALLHLGRLGGWVTGVALDRRSVSAAMPLRSEPVSPAHPGRAG